MREASRVLPRHDMVYLGDTARTPYGTRSSQTVLKFTLQALKFLFDRNCQLVILACNTASAEALREIQQKFLPANFPERRVLGVIIPSVEAAVENLDRGGSIGVLATEATVRSGAFDREIKSRRPDIEVVSEACPMFVPLVETGEEDVRILDAYARRYTASLVRAGVKSVVLGCTHYEALRENIAKRFSSNVRMIVQSEVVSEKLRDYLRRHPEIDERISRRGKREFFTTDSTERFARLGEKFYNASFEVRTAKIDDWQI